MVELVDTLALGASAARCKGSSPFPRTTLNHSTISDLAASAPEGEKAAAERLRNSSLPLERRLGSPATSRVGGLGLGVVPLCDADVRVPERGGDHRAGGAA